MREGQGLISCVLVTIGSSQGHIKDNFKNMSFWNLSSGRKQYIKFYIKIYNTIKFHTLIN